MRAEGKGKEEEVEDVSVVADGKEEWNGKLEGKAMCGRKKSERTEWKARREREGMEEVSDGGTGGKRRMEWKWRVLAACIRREEDRGERGRGRNGGSGKQEIEE